VALRFVGAPGVLLGPLYRRPRRWRWEQGGGRRGRLVGGVNGAARLTMVMRRHGAGGGTGGASTGRGNGAARRSDTTARRRPLQAALCRGRRCCAASTAVGRGVTRTGWRRVRVRARARAHDVAAALERLGCSRAQASGSGRRGARRGGRGLGTAGARAAVALPCSASACGRGGVELVRPWRRPGGRARWGGKEGRAGGARERQSREGGGESSARGRREREREREGEGKENGKKKRKRRGEK